MEGWGVDGCKTGWFYVGLDGTEVEFGVVDALEDLLVRVSPGASVLVDIPIGLRESGVVERTCDLHARRALSPRRGSSVFPAPSRSAVYAPDYEAASRLNRASLGKGLSKQSWAIAPKIREVDELLQARHSLRGRIREVHPEVCFWGLTGEAMEYSKKTREGFRERLAALSSVHPEAPEVVARAFLEYGGFEALRDDIVDAFVAALCASQIDRCLTLPELPETDSTGLKMEMVYWSPTAS